MSLQIVAELCTSCSACEPVCPNAAISFKKTTYVINPDLCNECEGHHDFPQCVDVCPIDDCIVPAAA